MLAAKQNQKFPFHFLSAPPTPPAEENKKGKENLWFLLPRPQGADEARIIGHQGSIQNTFELRSIHTATTGKDSRLAVRVGRRFEKTMGFERRNNIFSRKYCKPVKPSD